MLRCCCGDVMTPGATELELPQEWMLLPEERLRLLVEAPGDDAAALERCMLRRCCDDVMTPGLGSAAELELPQEWMLLPGEGLWLLGEAPGDDAAA